MIDWIKRFFGPSGSSTTAKERLRLVLMTDHLELSPDMIDAMKRDLVDVISRYVEVDREKIEVNFEQQDRALAMLANIPILSVNRPGNGNGHSERAERATSADSAPPTGAAPEPAMSVAGAPNVVSPGAHTATTGTGPPAAPNGIPTRKRRRRKKLQAATASP
jgi:cell division topological specificity factor